MSRPTCMIDIMNQETGMPELILGLYPQPEEPPETIVVVKDGRTIIVPTEDLWAYSGDAANYQPPTNEQQGDN